MIQYVDENGKALFGSDIARIRLWEIRSASVGEQEYLHQMLKGIDYSEQELKNAVAITADLINKGHDDLLSTYRHQLERVGRIELQNIERIRDTTDIIQDGKERVLDAHIALMKSLTKYGDYAFKKFMPYNLGIDRKDMPQIDDNEELRKKLDLKEDKIRIDALKPLQKEIELDKVDSFLASGYRVPNEWIVSADNYIMDGHHRWAASLEIFEPETEVNVYRSDLPAKEFYDQLTAVVKGDQIPGGLADNEKPKDFDPKELEMGIKVEMEHTNDPEIAKEIALDHLKEDKKYYSKLRSIEKAEVFVEALKLIDDRLYKAFEEMPLEDFQNKYSEVIDLIKATYVDNHENRKLGRVGKEYGGSKDDDGDVVYHGTEEDFDKFKDGVGDSWASEVGHWFTNQKDFAEQFGSRVISAKVKLKNPKVVSEKEFNKWREKHHNDKQFWADKKKEWMESGFDGLKIVGKDTMFAGQTMPANNFVVAFTSDQVDIKKGEGVINEYVAAICQRPDGKLLFLQRHFDDSFHPNTWNLPSGGVEDGEECYDAVRREFNEETGLEAELVYFAKEVKEANATIHYYYVQPKAFDPIVLLDSESQRYEWWDIDEFREQDLILDLEDHLMQILVKDSLVKADHSWAGKPPKGKEHLIPKKVLVKGKTKAYWQVKWVSPSEAVNKPFYKKYAIAVLAKKLKTEISALKDQLQDIESIVIDGGEFKIAKEMSGDVLLLEQTGKIPDSNKGINIFFKDKAKIQKFSESEEAQKPKEGEKTEKAIDYGNIIMTSLKNKKPLIFKSGEKYQVAGFDKAANWVRASKDGGDVKLYSYEKFIEMIKNDLSEKNKWKKVDYKQATIGLKDSDFKVIKSLGGSTGAKLVEDKDGKKWVRKDGNSKGHLENELLALNLYAMLGVNVPIERKRTENYMYNRYIDGTPLGQWEKGKSAEEIAEMRGKISAGFVVDALLGAWDVVGLAKDNIIIDKAGVPIRIDVGGSLEYRAQGKKKEKEEWSDAKGVPELTTLLDPKMNPQSAEVFQDVSLGDIMKQVDKLPSSLPSWVQPKGVKDVLTKRLKFLKDKYEGEPTNLEDIGDLYEVPKNAKAEVKAFYQNLNKQMAFTPKDQKILSMLAISGDNEARNLANEQDAYNKMTAMFPKEIIDGFKEVGVGAREQYALYLHMHSTSYSTRFNKAVVGLTGTWNLVEEGKVVKYKEEFKDEAREAFNKNDLLIDRLERFKRISQHAKKGVGTSYEAAYGVAHTQELEGIVKMLQSTVDNPKNEIEKEIAQFYKGHADGILNAFNTMGEYTEEIGGYIPSDAVKEKYAEVVDLSFASNPVTWENIIEQSTSPKTGAGMSEFDKWSNTQAMKDLIAVKLIARGLTVAERFKGDSKYINKGGMLSRKISPKDMNKFLDEHKEGNKLFWSSVSSCSENFKVWDHHHVKTRIKPIQTLRTMYISPFKSSEIENTMKPFAKFHVTGVEKQGGLIFVNLTQIG